MCGITGYISINNNLNHSHEYLQNALSTLSKRGPDNNSFFRDEKCELGHARLSIIDTSDAANQPMADATNRFVLVFNGEIYNYQSIKNELSKKGHQFSTSSDTEVVLHAYMEYKEKCVEHFNGFFAFCIYDKVSDPIPQSSCYNKVSDVT